MNYVKMIMFRSREIGLAMGYAEGGGQALHVWSPPKDKNGNSHWGGEEPACFRSSKEWAHLIDYDHDRLYKTALLFGVRSVVISRKGRRGQNVDLCGQPLRKAISLANKNFQELVDNFMREL